uniref:Profilin n=1 Tax=Panagrolaimus davidi TaxID=227884 RepID=A0A914PJK5_9BILA
MDAQAIRERLEKLTYRQLQQEAKKNGVKAKGTWEILLKNIIEKLALEPFDSSSENADSNMNNNGLPENEQVNSTAIVAADSTIQVLDKADDETTMASTSAAMNESVSPENEEVDATLSKRIFHRRESLPTFLSINPTTIAASAYAEGKPRRNSIDVGRSQKSLQIKKYSTKSNDFLNTAFINDKENDKLEYYDIIVEEEDENELSDVFEVEEKRYERVLYLPKAVEDSDIDYKKKYQQLYQKYQKREERIADVIKLIMEGKSRDDVLQRLRGILTHQKPVSSVKKVAVEDTVNVSQIELSLIAGWQAYITNLLDNSEGIKRAAIVGTDGAVWAKSEGENEFRATEAELRSFVNNFNNLNDVHAKGADLEGVHYIVPLTDENLIIGEKDKSGFFAVKTNITVIIAVFEGETSDCTEALTNVVTLATHLSQNGY